MNVTAKNSIYQGAEGNLCQVDCANQGICDYSTGTCKCFDGQYGMDCATNDATITYSYWEKAVDTDDF